MAAGLRRLSQAEDLPAARTAFAVLVLPAQYRVRWRTTNGMERLNEAMRPIWWSTTDITSVFDVLVPPRMSDAKRRILTRTVGSWR